MSRVAGNHFLVFALLLFAMAPRSAGFLLLLAGLVIFVPISLDPLRNLSKERLLLFPFTARERAHIRILGFLFSPVPWVILAVPVWAGSRYLRVSLALLGLATVTNTVSLLWRRDTGKIRRFNHCGWLLIWPSPLGGLVVKNLREMLHLLDPYAGLALALAATVYRFTLPVSNPEAVLGLTLLVALTLSSAAQRLFALDSKDGLTRYTLMPMAGWRILLAKDVAFLLVLSLLVLPLNPLSGWAAGLTLLTFGHRPSVLDPQRQPPWCFVSGARGWSGLIQVLAMFGVGIATFRWSPLILLPCLVSYLGSLFYFGARLEVRWRGGR